MTAEPRKAVAMVCLTYQDYWLFVLFLFFFETDFGYVTQITLELLATVLSLSQPTKCQGHMDFFFFI